MSLIHVVLCSHMAMALALTEIQLSPSVAIPLALILQVTRRGAVVASPRAAARDDRTRRAFAALASGGAARAGSCRCRRHKVVTIMAERFIGSW